MAIINKGKSFANGEQLTADKLNQVIDNATFTTSAVDNVSTQLAGEAIIVKDGGVTTAKIADANVTFAKLTDVIDDDTMATASATKLATSESIKAYTDTRALDPTRGYNSFSHNTDSETVTENTTERPLFVSFTLYSTNDIDYLFLEISPNSNMSGSTKIAQTRIVSDGSLPSGGQVCGIVPSGWYWEISYSGSTFSEKVHCSFAL